MLIFSPRVQCQPPTMTSSPLALHPAMTNSAVCSHIMPMQRIDAPGIPSAAAFGAGFEAPCRIPSLPWNRPDIRSDLRERFALYRQQSAFQQLAKEAHSCGMAWRRCGGETIRKKVLIELLAKGKLVSLRPLGPDFEKSIVARVAQRTSSAEQAVSRYYRIDPTRLNKGLEIYRGRFGLAVLMCDLRTVQPWFEWSPSAYWVVDRLAAEMGISSQMLMDQQLWEMQSHEGGAHLEAGLLSFLKVGRDPERDYRSPPIPEYLPPPPQKAAGPISEVEKIRNDYFKRSEEVVRSIAKTGLTGMERFTPRDVREGISAPLMMALAQEWHALDLRYYLVFYPDLTREERRELAALWKGVVSLSQRLAAAMIKPEEKMVRNLLIQPAFVTRGHAKVLQDCQRMIAERTYEFPADKMIDNRLLFLAGECYKAMRDFRCEASDDDHDLELATQLKQLLLDAVEHNIAVKRLRHDADRSHPLDLNEELLLLENLRYVGFVTMNRAPWLRDVYRSLAKMHGDLSRHADEMKIKKDPSPEGMSDYLAYLFERRKYREMLHYRFRHWSSPIDESSQEFLQRALEKVQQRLWYDEQGFPVTDENAAAYAWSNLASYRQRFEQVEWDKPGAFETGLKILHRASVAKLLEQLVDYDLDLGELHDCSTTSLCWVDLPDHAPEDASWLQTLGDRFDAASAVSIPELLRPFYEALEKEQKAFLQKLKEMPIEKKILERPGPGGLKGPESLLLKTLKVDPEEDPKKDLKEAVGKVTDIIGFMLITRNDDDAFNINTVVEGMMGSEVKRYYNWERPNPRGLRSLDITGIPRGFHYFIQVQSRTWDDEMANDGSRSHHDAYKVITGKLLRDQIDADPDASLDRLYRVLHRLHNAYRKWKENPGLSPEAIIALYQETSDEGISLIRKTDLF